MNDKELRIKIINHKLLLSEFCDKNPDKIINDVYGNYTDYINFLEELIVNLKMNSIIKYTEKELRDWWPAICPECGWRGLSRDCTGGRPIADTGDCDDVLCPICYKFTNRNVVVLDDDNIQVVSNPLHELG